MLVYKTIFHIDVLSYLKINLNNRMSQHLSKVPINNNIIRFLFQQYNFNYKYTSHVNIKQMQTL
jgi:hypothetical protein